MKKLVDRVPWKLFALAALAAAASCSGSDDVGHGGKNKPKIAPSDWAVHIFAGQPGHWRKVDFPPVREISFPMEGNAPEAVGTAKGSLTHTQGLIQTPEGGVVTPDDLSAANGWALVYGAALECGLSDRDAKSTILAQPNPFIQMKEAKVPAWLNASSSAWGIFDSAPDSCDSTLAYTETLLCIANELATVADTVSPMHWEVVGSINPPSGIPRGPWTIPPQASKDRFIARDLAIYILANLVVTEHWFTMQDETSHTYTCSAAYAKAADTTSTFGYLKRQQLFGTTSSSLYYPPVNVSLNSAANIASVAEGRLHVQTQVLRTAARLLDELIDKSVEADLAGSQRRRSRATDPESGSNIAWGKEDNENGNYNTLAHATRVISGRWEMGSSTGGATAPFYKTDPFCGGVGATAGLGTEAYGADLTARIFDKGVTTNGRKNALDIVQSAGIVLPKSALSSLPTVKTAIKDQITETAAIAHGYASSGTEFTTFMTSAQGKSIAAVLDGVSDADWTFALEKNLNHYRLLTATDDTATDIHTPVAGLQAASHNAATLTSAGGIALAAGIPRSDLSIDIDSRIGGMQIASQCDENGGFPALIMSDTSFRTAFQDSYSLGQEISRRLVFLREKVRYVSGLEDVLAEAQGAATEVRAWTGPGRVFAVAEFTGSRWPSNPAPASTINVAVLGMEASDFAVSDYNDAINEVVLVYGPPWVADCAARLRANCPSNFDSNYVMHATTANSSVFPPGAVADGIGFDGIGLALEFPGADGGKPNFQPAFSQATSPPDHLYAVLLHDPKSPSKNGRVLGGIALRNPNIVNNQDFGGTSVPVSYKQKKHFDDIVGLRTKGMHRLTTGHPGASEGPAYCIEGVPKDLFVPLENELTSDSDQYENSWKHYLNLAKDSAAKADSLAEKLIEIGTQRELRRESAGEALAETCGDFSAADKVGVDDGKVTAPPDDANLQSCLDEQPYDIVFLTNDPTSDPAVTNGDPKAFIDALIGCPAAGTMCDLGVNTGVQGDIVTHGLNMAPYETEPSNPVPSECDSMPAIAASLETGFDGATAQGFAAAEWMQPAQLKTLSQKLHAELLSTGVWSLYFGAEKRMTSEAGGLWPGCRRTGQTCAAPTEADLFDKLFRQITTTGAALGTAVGTSGADSEANAIFWRVQGALWMLGALAGAVPAKMFDVQLPAVNFNADGWDNDTDPRAPVFTVYGTGRFDLSGGTYQLDVNSPDAVDDSERNELKAATAMNGVFYWPSGQVPQWLSDIYVSASNKYVQVQGVNPEIANLGPGNNVGNWLSQQVARFNGMACSVSGAVSFSGDPTLGAPSPDQLKATQEISKARSGSSWGKVCSNYAFPYLWLSIDAQGRPKSHFNDLFEITESTDVLTTPPISYWAKQDIMQFPSGSLDSNGVFTLPGTGELLDTSVTFGGFGQTYRLNFGDTPPCRHPRYNHTTLAGAGEGGIHFIQQSHEHLGTWLGSPCAKDTFTSVSDTENIQANPFIRYTRRMLLPRSCTAHNRVQAFVNSYPPDGACAGVAQLAQAFALACQLGESGIASSPDVPILKSLADLDGFVRWIDRLSRDAHFQVSKLYLEKLPKRVVDDFSAEKVGSGPLKGEHGEQLLELRGALESLKQGWNTVSLQLSQLKAAVDTARLAIQAANIQEGTALANLALTRMQIHASMAGAAAGALSIGSGNIGALANAPLAMDFGAMELEQTKQIEQQAANGQETAVNQALNQLQVASGPLYTELQNALSNIRSSATTVLTIKTQIEQSQNKAKYEAAQVAGADYVVIDGQTVMLPVNTVQRRLYDITKIRYERALHDAKYYAYVARLAIEQRIGLHLMTIDTPVGPLEAPHEWADDICTLQGINFDDLKNFEIPDGGTDNDAAAAAEQETISQFADQFVGDYVTKLENFVEFYNIQYPSHDADDTTVLSLRDDLLGPSTGCVKDGPNLLYYSSDLTAQDYVDVGGVSVKRGWELNSCDPWDSECLRVEPQGVVLSPPPLPGDAGGGGFAWLHDTTPPGSPTLPEAGAPDAGANPAPARTVSQVVSLTAGASYKVSWWDAARAADGAFPTADSPQYTVYVLAPDGTQVASYVGTPFRPASSTDPQQWSTRHAMDFTAQDGGDYRVVFAAAAAASAAGTVLISDVQLEQGAPGAAPVGYVNTGSSRQFVSFECKGHTAAQVQQAFTHSCDKNGKCFYELTAPLVIDTSELAKGNSNLVGKLAAGNYNFRHVTIAVNLVGTGVYDCMTNPSQSCFASAYLDYTIDHDAFDVGVLGYNGEFQEFNFGSGEINHGKALAAERYITVPIASADQTFLSEPGVEHPEFRGRPLDGSYRFRIWDSPYLAWNRLEDVQFVLKYRYWSPIQPQSTRQ